MRREHLKGKRLVAYLPPQGRGNASALGRRPALAVPGDGKALALGFPDKGAQTDRPLLQLEVGVLAGGQPQGGRRVAGLVGPTLLEPRLRSSGYQTWLVTVWYFTASRVRVQKTYRDWPREYRACSRRPLRPTEWWK